MENKKTIIFVTASSNLRGGDFSLMSIIRILEQKGIKSVVILSKEGKSSNYWRKNNINCLCIPFKTWTTKRNNRFMKKMSFIAKRFYHKYLIKKYKNNIIDLCGENVLCVYNNGFTNFFGCELSKELHVKYVQHIREFGDLDFNLNFELGKIGTFSMIEPKCSAIIAISNAVKQSFSSSKQYNRIKVIYNGIEKPEMIKNISTNDKKHVIKFIMSGSLSPEKNHMDLLRAAKILVDNNYTNFQIDIYGNGTQKEIIEDYIKKYSLDKYIKLKGFVLNIDYQKYDVGIMASRSEGFGRVTVEYMMNGLATIASDSGANPEIINNGVDGILYEHDNYIELSKKMIYLLENTSMINIIGKKAITSSTERFTEEIYKNNIYNYLIESKIILK